MSKHKTGKTKRARKKAAKRRAYRARKLSKHAVDMAEEQGVGFHHTEDRP